MAFFLDKTELFWDFSRWNWNVFGTNFDLRVFVTHVSEIKAAIGYLELIKKT